jgi:DNA repair protein RecN (Recombination protein N)
LARVHGVEADELPARALALQDELDELESLDLSLDEARRAREGVAAGALEVALAERTARLAAALRVEGAVAGELSGLAMPAARFGVVLHPVDQGERLPGGERLGAGGLDRAAFLLSANPGEDPRPLATVASGGELSRVLLALKCVLHGDDAPGSGAHVGTFVFDEVDTGIGGDTAERVGFRLADLALRRQLLVITHLPQIAAMAATWFSVDKVVAEGRTFSQVQVLDRPAREVELARMVGGVLDPAARRWARAVLDRHETLPT